MPHQTGNGHSRPRSGETAGGRPSPGNQVIPHDSFFKKVFGKPENAASELRAVLPPGLTARLDLGRLAPVPGTFVDEALRQRHTDVLFSAPLNGEDAFVYVLMEHQSSNDNLMAFRMLRYVMRIWDRYVQDNPRARRLPAVIPLVIYNGKGHWSAPRRLQDLIGPAPDPRAEYLPRFSFLLDDLAAIDGKQLRDRDVIPVVRVTTVSFKEAPGNPWAYEVLWELIGDLHAILSQPGGLEFFVALLTYIREVGEGPDSELGRVADELGPAAKEAYMTTADMLEARGEARGTLRGRAEALLQILDARFGPLPEGTDKTVHGGTGDQLKTWTTRAATVATLDEVFG